MKVYKTANIYMNEIEEVTEAHDLSSIDFCDDPQNKKWLYKGSLTEYLQDIPCEFEALIPLSYFKHSQFVKKAIVGNTLFECSFQLETASEVINAITEAMVPINLDTSFDDLKHYIVLVASELVRNGIILNLKNQEKKEVRLTILESNDDIIINIADTYGQLKCLDITKRLKAIAKTGEYERKEYGAGLGLFMVIKAVDTIQFTIIKNSKTEILCSINKYKRLKHFKEKGTAVFFEEKD